MSIYEKYSIVISAIAVLISILTPIIQWAYKKWIKSAKVKYYPTGQATLFFNQSGSYIRLNGVIESENKAVTIKKMSIALTRKRDDQKLNLVWTYLISPVSQSMLGNFVQTTEIAHPFRVEADSVACAFIEYGDPSNSSSIKIRKLCSDLKPIFQQNFVNKPYKEAIEICTKTPEYMDAKNSMLSDFYWEIGKYNAVVIIEYDKQKKKEFSYEFEVSDQSSLSLRHNIDESLIAEVKNANRVPLSFQAPFVELSEKKQ